MQQDVKTKIINAARESIYQDGYTAVTMSEIRQRAGVEKNDIDQYFNSKKEVALAVIAQITDLWDQELIQPILIPKTGKQAISAMLDWIVALHEQKDVKFSYSLSNILAELYTVAHDFAVPIDRFTDTWVAILATKISEMHPGMGDTNSHLQAKNAVKLLESMMVMTKVTGQIEPLTAAIREIKLKLRL